MSLIILRCRYQNRKGGLDDCVRAGRAYKVICCNFSRKITFLSGNNICYLCGMSTV